VEARKILVAPIARRAELGCLPLGEKP